MPITELNTKHKSTILFKYQCQCVIATNFVFKIINTITMNVNLTLIHRLLPGTLNVSQDKINKIIYSFILLLVMLHVWKESKKKTSTK